MRAARITGPGPREAVQVGELPAPVPGQTDALVAVEVSAVNPADTFIRSGRYLRPMPLLFVIGRDLDGAATASCPGSGFAPGECEHTHALGHGPVRSRRGNDLAGEPGYMLYCPRVRASGRSHDGAAGVLTR
jgi:hypothetical protein